MKRFSTLIASLVLLSTLSPALAFSDVPADAWYSSSVTFCQETGLMNGTGRDHFSPGDPLTLAEVMTGSARLHHRTHGGTGDIPRAPDAWGTGAITTPSGAVLLSFRSSDLERGLTYTYDTQVPRRLHLTLRVTEQELWALTPAGGTANAALTLNGNRVLVGGLAPVKSGESKMEFIAAPGSDYAAFNHAFSSFLPALSTKLWYRNSLWYARENGLWDAQPMDTPFESPATRQDLAEWLASALPVENLRVLHAISALPDTTDPDVLTLYRAGILTGVDNQGTFGGEQRLTRAELAVVLARAADPARRV